jgi:DNA-binding NarL/FixJ family response regulator
MAGGRVDPAGAAMIRVVLVDDQSLVRVGIAALLTGDDGGRPIAVVGEASDGGDGVAVVRRERPDVVLMDIRMPGTDGITATRRIRADPDLGGVAVLILTTFDTDPEVLGALRAGADGYLLKDTTPRRLRAAVRDAAEGRPVLSPDIARQVMAHAAAAPVPEPDPRLGRLTAREREVLTALAHGEDNATIARRLHLSPETVRTYVSRLLTKLDAGSRARLVAIAHSSGLGR